MAANGTSDAGAVAGAANHTAPAAAAGKLNVFISYSRADEAFADELFAGLVYSGYPCELDRHSIRQGEDWKLRLGALIAAADTVVFVLSPDSARSEVCQWEVEHAHALAKRIIPVLWRGLHERPLGKRADGSAWPEGPPNAPPRLAALNYVRFDDHDDGRRRSFMAGLTGLVQALEDDLEWLRAHSRLLIKAREWEEGGRAINRLLSGADVVAAKALADRRKPTAPSFTDLQLDFVKASETEETRKAEETRSTIAERERLAAEREAAARRAEEAAKLSQGLILWLSMAALGGIAIVSYADWDFPVDRWFFVVHLSLFIGAFGGHFCQFKVVRDEWYKIYFSLGIFVAAFMTLSTGLRAGPVDFDRLLSWGVLGLVQFPVLYVLARRFVSLPDASTMSVLRFYLVNLADAVVCASACAVWVLVWNSVSPAMGVGYALPVDLKLMALQVFVVCLMLMPLRFVFAIIRR